MKNLIGVQTNWADGTVFKKSHSGANTNTVIVYGGGKIDINIPPCDGSANNSRKGYSIWAPDELATNYINSSHLPFYNGKWLMIWEIIHIFFTARRNVAKPK